MEPERPSRLSDAQWRAAAWASVAVGVVAVGALIAVWVGAATRTPEAERRAATSTTTTSTTVDPESVPSAMELIDTPVRGAVVIDHPVVGTIGRYHRDGGVVVVRVTTDFCGRSGGMLRAAGTVRNESKLGQRFHYSLSLVVKRPVTGAVLAELVAGVEDVGPGETAEWTVEEASTKATAVQCVVTALEAVPVDAAETR